MESELAGYRLALARWGAARLAQEATAWSREAIEASDIDLDTVDVVFEYEAPWAYSEYTAGGGVAEVRITGSTYTGRPLAVELERSFGMDFTWSLASIAGEIAGYAVAVEEAPAFD